MLRSGKMMANVMISITLKTVHMIKEIAVGAMLSINIVSIAAA